MIRKILFAVSNAVRRLTWKADKIADKAAAFTGHVRDSVSAAATVGYFVEFWTRCRHERESLEEDHEPEEIAEQLLLKRKAFKTYAKSAMWIWRPGHGRRLRISDFYCRPDRTAKFWTAVEEARLGTIPGPDWVGAIKAYFKAFSEESLDEARLKAEVSGDQDLARVLAQGE